MFNMSRETAEAVEVLNSEDFSSIHPALTEAVMTTTTNDDSQLFLFLVNYVYVVQELNI